MNRGYRYQGRIHDFKLGEGAQLKKLRRAEGGAKIFWVFRVKNHDFTPKKSYFFQLRREAQQFLGCFVWKIPILRQKNIFFPILGGGGCRTRRPPSGSAPGYSGSPKVHYGIIGIIYFWGLALFFCMVNGSGSPKIIDIYYEKVLPFIEFCFSRKGKVYNKVYNDTLLDEPLKVNIGNYD
jgi:hypothetical protein